MRYLGLIGGEEERRDEVVLRAGHLRADDPAREVEVVVVVAHYLAGGVLHLEHFVGVLEQWDRVLVVHREQRLAVGLRVEVGERLEVADHRVGVERAHLTHVRVHVVERVAGALREDLERRAIAVDRVVLVEERQPADLDHIVEVLGQKRVGAAAHDDLERVTARREMFEYDARAHRVAHPLTDHTVENLHVALQLR